MTMFYEDAITMTKPTDADDLLSPDGACAIYERMIRYAERNPGFASNRMLNDYRAKLAEYQQRAADEKEQRMQAARLRQRSSDNVTAILADIQQAYAVLYGLEVRHDAQGRESLPDVSGVPAPKGE